MSVYHYMKEGLGLRQGGFYSPLKFEREEGVAWI
jgi:hypothetical protein